MKITIFGSGYVGLVTGACLADAGHSITCIDDDESKIALLNRGEIPIFEPGLAGLVRANVAAARLSFTSDVEAAVAFGELIFIAVGTPPDEDGSADLQYVLAVAASIGANMHGYKLVINKSTVPVGTADRVKDVVSSALGLRNQVLDFDVCSNPEFLKEGAAIDDFKKGPRIIVGTDSPRVMEKMRECYAPYNRNRDKLIFMGIRAAELTKYAANAMLATKISFMNEIANIAELLGTDIEEVRRGIGSDPRIGYDFIYPGCGYGGSCFPKDVQALQRTAVQAGYQPNLLASVEELNTRQKEVLFSKLNGALRGNLSGKTIAVWGLAFKPNTDDMRDAPSVSLLKTLMPTGAKIQAYDPEANSECARIFDGFSNLKIVATAAEAVSGADALVICTEWSEFRSVDLLWLKETLRDAVVIDGRNLYDPKRCEEIGLHYYGVGRGVSTRAPQ